MSTMRSSFTCGQCGFIVELTTEPPRFGDLKCDECGATIELHPRRQVAPGLSDDATPDQDAAAVRRMVDRIRRGE
jgi:hypothetical protein